MWLIVGTVPDNEFQLYTDALYAGINIEDGFIHLPGDHKLPIVRGTAALAATAFNCCHALAVPMPRLLLVGDCGTGSGSHLAYKWLSENIAAIAQKEDLAGLTFHYFYPDLDGHNRLYAALDELRPRPILVADAGFMYAAKMSGYAQCYDLFTPDIGELAFLADEKAPHPFYTRGLLLSRENDAPGLIYRALNYQNCPPNMIVKGQTDYIVCKGKIIAEVAEPSEPAMECIGGTGDIVTGFATAFLAAGLPICKASVAAALASRYLAEFCKPTPASQAAELICKIAPMLAKHMNKIFPPVT